MPDRVPVGVLISGRGSNMAALIEATTDEACPYEVVLVASNVVDAPGLEVAVRAGVPIWAEARASRFTTSRVQTVAALHRAVIDDAGRDEANLACALHLRRAYGIWRD